MKLNLYSTSSVLYHKYIDSYRFRSVSKTTLEILKFTVVGFFLGPLVKNNKFVEISVNLIFKNYTKEYSDELFDEVLKQQGLYFTGREKKEESRRRKTEKRRT